MKIIIEYEASWRNSFLDGSNNESLPKIGRNFIASMTSLKQQGNFIQRKITKETVMGVLNRLIGEQRKLYQARCDVDYYFADIENSLRESDIVDNPSITDEMVYIRNITGSTDQNSFTGLIKADDPSFNSSFSSELWGLLWLDLDKILDFIVTPSREIFFSDDLEPIKVCEKFESLSNSKPIEVEGKIKDAFEVLQNNFPEVNYLTAKNQLPLVSLYTSALYLQIERLRQRYDLSGILTKNQGLSGISKRGFTKKDFMARYTTGNKKIIWGNPYLLEERKKGEGKVSSLLRKATGTLKINLSIPHEQAKDLEQKILDAGVSSFYLGKKGLAYLKDIQI